MPTSQELIRDFTQKSHVEIDGDLIRNTIENLLSKTNILRTREQNIEKYIVSTYSKLAAEFERRRAEDMLYSPDTASKTSSFEFFNGYVNIISEVAKEASAQLLTRVETEKEYLKQAVADAKQKYDDAQKELETRETNYKAHHNGSLDGINEIEEYKKYKDDVAIAKIKLENAERKQEQGVSSIASFEQFRPYFGMSAKTAKSLLDRQVKTCNYMDLRREQIERSGFRSNSYVLEVENVVIPENVTYKTATAEQKRQLQEIYATKQIMQEKLNGRTTGTFAWFKRWWYRKDIAALNNYLFAANQKLSGAKLDQDDMADAIDAMTEKGFFHGEYKASGAETVLDEQLAKNSEMKTRYANNDKYVNEGAKKDAASQMFDPYFRPTVDGLKNQIKIGNDVGSKFVKGNATLDPKAKSVFNMNMKKLRAMKEHLDKYADPKRHRSAEEIQENYELVIADFEEKEKDFICQNPDYVPVTIEDVQASMPQRESVSNIVANDIKDHEANTELSQPVVVDDLAKNKDEISIN